MNLFDRLPAGLFGPLTGRNARRAWELLERLGTTYFGADCIPPYPDGYLHDQITKEIERFLLDQRWQREDDGEPEATPLNVQANMLLRRLLDSGWLVEDQVGAKAFVSMRPVVARFFETLNQFTEEGPQLIGGSVQMVHNQLLSVAKAPREQAQGFMSAATLCSQLIKALSATTFRARDLMRELTKENDTPVFLRRFFTEHIEVLYVRDFKDLRTENHPLRLRWDILELVRKVTRDERLRAELLAGYAGLAKPGEDVERLLDRDAARFDRLMDVEQFLERMDLVMEQATQRAIAYIGYRLSASDRIEAVIKDTVDALDRAEQMNVPISGRLIAPMPTVCDLRLRLPAPIAPKPERKPMRKRELTLREKALLMLRREMIANRDGSAKAVRRYVEALLPAGGSIDAQSLPADTVVDAVAYLALLRLGAMAKHNPQGYASNPLLKRLGFEVKIDPAGHRVDTPLYETTGFTVTRKAEDAA